MPFSGDDRRGGPPRDALASALRADPGLCGTCRHAHRVDTARGGTFWRCGRAADDPRFRRYPQLPVGTCPGHERGSPA